MRTRLRKAHNFCRPSHSMPPTQEAFIILTETLRSMMKENGIPYIVRSCKGSVAIKDEGNPAKHEGYNQLYIALGEDGKDMFTFALRNTDEHGAVTDVKLVREGDGDFMNFVCEHSCQFMKTVRSLRRTREIENFFARLHSLRPAPVRTNQKS